MGLMMATIRENPRAIRKNDYGLENALAKWVRARWTDKCIPNTAHYFGLSESEAAKVVYANASKATLNKLLHHKRGGFGLYLELICDVTNTKLEDHIIQQAEEARRDRIESEARERAAADILARLAERRRLDWVDADAHRDGRPEHAALGSPRDGEAVERSFAPRRRRT